MHTNKLRNKLEIMIKCIELEQTVILEGKHVASLKVGFWDHYCLSVTPYYFIVYTIFFFDTFLSKYIVN